MFNFAPVKEKVPTRFVLLRKGVKAWVSFGLMHEVTEKIAVRVCCFSRLLQAMTGFVRGDKKRYSEVKRECLYFWSGSHNFAQ